MILLLISVVIGDVCEFFLELKYGKDIFKLDFRLYKSFLNVFLEVVILAPLLETLLIQFILIETLLFLFSKLGLSKTIPSILFSAFIFGVLHQYNIAYMIATFFLGLFWGMLYLFFKKGGKINPFFGVFVIHSLYNLINLLKEYYFTI